MFPTCSNRFLAGRNARSAIAPAIRLAVSGTANGHPPETLHAPPVHQRAERAHAGTDLPGRASLLAGLGRRDDLPPVPGGVGDHRVADLAGAPLAPRPPPRRLARPGELGEQGVAGLRRARLTPAIRGSAGARRWLGRLQVPRIAASSASSLPIWRRSSRRAAGASPASSQESSSSSSEARSSRSSSGASGSASGGSPASRASGRAAETRVVIATSRGSTPAARAASIASAAIRSTSGDPAARSAT